jgi:ABC-type sugar transport system, periplasmic component
MKQVKKAASFALCLTMAAGLTLGLSTSGSASTVSKQSNASYSGAITVWSSTNELQQSKYINAFNKVYPNIKVTYVVTPADNNEYQTKLNTAMSSDAGAPDVFLCENTYIKKYANSSFTEDLSAAPYKADSLTKNMVKYVVQLSKSTNGHLKGLSWQSTPGGVFYRRSLAKKYFGTDDPTKVSALISSYSKLIASGKKLKTESKNKVKMLSTYKDLYVISNGARTTPWVKNGALTLDSKIKEYIDVAKNVRTSGIDANADSWSSPWSASMVNDTVFAYVLPTWGEGVIKAYAPKTTGDWGVAKAPYSYYDGGTFMSIYSQSKNKTLAWQFVKYLCTDKDFNTQHDKDYGDFSSNLDVIKKFATTSIGNDKFCGGQNISKMYNTILPKISASTITEYDSNLNTFFQTELDLYVNNKISKSDLLKKFGFDVKSAYPDINTSVTGS